MTLRDVLRRVDMSDLDKVLIWSLTYVVEAYFPLISAIVVFKPDSAVYIVVESLDFILISVLYNVIDCAVYVLPLTE